jgi:hypothetical protein
VKKTMATVNQRDNALNPRGIGASPELRVAQGRSGFIKHGDQWIYLHADGATCANGAYSGPVINPLPVELASLKLELPLADRVASDASPHGQPDFARAVMPDPERRVLRERIWRALSTSFDGIGVKAAPAGQP